LLSKFKYPLISIFEFVAVKIKLFAEVLDIVLVKILTLSTSKPLLLSSARKDPSTSNVILLGASPVLASCVSTLVSPSDIATGEK